MTMVMKLLQKLLESEILMESFHTTELTFSWTKSLQKQSIFYRCRWERTELTFKALQSGDGIRTINLSLKEIILTFMLGNVLTYFFKQLIATVVKRLSKATGSFSILRNHTAMEVAEQRIRAFTRAENSRIYSNLNRCKDKILEDCT